MAQYPGRYSQCTACIRRAVGDSDNDSLILLSTHLRTEILDLTATHSLTQIYYNPTKSADNSDNNEYVYTFPLYESSAVTSFTANINNTRTLNAVIKPRQEARDTYDKAKSENKLAVLLESNTSDVFTASIGNIPPRALARIEISYLHDLNQDLDTDGVKLVIPTVITPRYGQLPEGMSAAEILNQHTDTFGTISTTGYHNCPIEGIALDINITMSGSIQEIQSSSHPLTVTIGSYTTQRSNSICAHDPKKANARLANSKSLTHLEKDFILTIRAESLDKPRAFLAPHPTNPELATLLVTLVPKFVLPQQHKEVVLVVDRSGSMWGSKIETVKAAIHLLLASLPVGVHFNICSFGSRHDFLFEKSQIYDQDSLAQAKAHVDSMYANYGGTEMFDPLKETISRRLPDLPLEILFLTDGDVWNGQPLLHMLQTAAKQGVRLFSLGIGDSISHSLIEGIARAGGGYAQTVTLQERLERKILRMLKAALTPQVTDWSIDWAAEREAEAAFTPRKLLQAKSQTESRPQAEVEAPAISKSVNLDLYDKVTDREDMPILRLPGPREMLIPSIIQAPRDIPPLFPYSRTAVYFLLFKQSPPKEVMLSGSFHDKSDNSVTPLELSIPVTSLDTSEGVMLPTLFARKYLQDLSEGRYPLRFTTFFDGDTQPDKYTALIEREGTRIGLQYSLASKWTSFVAVDEGGAEVQSTIDVEIRPQYTGGGGSGRGLGQGGAMRHRRIRGIASSLTSHHQFANKAARRSVPSTGGIKKPQRNQGKKSGHGWTRRKQHCSTTATQSGTSDIASDATTKQAQTGIASTDALAPSTQMKRTRYSLRSGGRGISPPSGIIEERDTPTGRKRVKFELEPPESPEEILATISKEQSFNGRFALTDGLLAALGVARDRITIPSKEKWILATVLVIKFLENDKRMVNMKEDWELVHRKAKQAVAAISSKKAEGTVRRILGLE